MRILQIDVSVLSVACWDDGTVLLLLLLFLFPLYVIFNCVFSLFLIAIQGILIPK